MAAPRPLVALALLAATGGAAAAQPKAVALEVDGSCPDRAAMERALGAEGLAVDATARFVLRVSATNGGAAMALSKAGGEPLAQRSTTSTDCDAIADAFAVIASMRLAEATVELPARSPARSPAPSPAPSPAEEQRPPRRLRPPPPESPAQTAPTTPPATPADYLVSASLSAGLDTGVGPSAASGLGAGVAVANRRGHGVRLSVARTGGFDTGTPIQWSSLSARLELFTELRRRSAWLRPGAGAALVATTIHGDGLATMPTVVRTQPAVSGSLVGGVSVARRVALRLELAGNLYPVTDRYLYQGDLVATSARASLSANLGVQIDTDW